MGNIQVNELAGLNCPSYVIHYDGRVRNIIVCMSIFYEYMELQLIGATFYN